MNRLAFSLLISLATHAAGAQTPPVYRCGNTYSQAPCPNAQIVDADDARTPEQRADAARVTSEAKRSAAAMERDRLAAEAREKPAHAGRLSAAPPASPASPASAVRHIRRARRAAPRAGRNPVTEVDRPAVARPGGAN